jgi:hypothetical protein
MKSNGQFQKPNLNAKKRAVLRRNVSHESRGTQLRLNGLRKTKTQAELVQLGNLKLTGN